MDDYHSEKCITKHSKDVLNEIGITAPRLVIQ